MWKLTEDINNKYVSELIYTKKKEFENNFAYELQIRNKLL